MLVDIRAQSALASDLIERKRKNIDGSNTDLQVDRYRGFARGVLSMASIQGEDTVDLKLLIEKYVVELDGTKSPLQII